MPDDITVEVVRLWLDERGRDRGFIFDGFPRTRAQAEAFDRLLGEKGLPVTVAVLLDASEGDILERVLGRLSCEKCGALYHRKFVPAQQPGLCDQCGGKLARRADDTAETVRKRLDIYRELTLDVGGRQTLDRGGHLRLLFMGGRAIQAVTRQNSEPSWIAYVGLQVLLGPKEKEVPGETP